jgi:HPr kinase/phosphorylase
MVNLPPFNLHASCVQFEGAGLLIRGPSGSGKSDLAIRLIDAGARLVADDRTELVREGNRLIASAPRAIAGLLEARGVGIVRVPALARAAIALVVDLAPAEAVERMPGNSRVSLLGLKVPRLRLDPFQASSVAKLRLYLRRPAL